MYGMHNVKVIFFYYQGQIVRWRDWQPHQIYRWIRLWKATVDKSKLLLGMRSIRSSQLVTNMVLLLCGCSTRY